MADPSQHQSSKASFRVETITDRLSYPWAIDFLPDGRMVVTERRGDIRIVTPDGAISRPLGGVPRVLAKGQGGLLDLTLHPDFARNRFVYFTFSEPGPGGSSTAAARGRLSSDDTALERVEIIFSQRPKLPGTNHYGSRLVFDGDGHIFIGLGERFADRTRAQAQELSSHLGKIVRLNEDGKVPTDNPYFGKPGALPEIWSLGHRNIQCAAIDPESGVLWEIEHGPLGGDELNIVRPTANYGWPVISYGVNYDGTPVGTGKAEAEGFEPPVRQWTPVIAPSGMMFYGGDAFPAWRGSLFVGGLASTCIVRLEREGNRITAEERLITDLGLRIRDVAEGPDGTIYAVTDESPGHILRLVPD